MIIFKHQIYRIDHLIRKARLVKFQNIDEPIVLYVHNGKGGVAHLTFTAYGQGIHDDLSNLLHCFMLNGEIDSHGGC